MKSRLLPAAIGLVALFWILAGFRPDQPVEPFDLRSWGALPVQADGRLKPLDTVARSHLLIFHGKQTLRTPEGERMTALQWLWEVVYRAPGARQHAVFRIDQPELVSLLGFEPGTKNDFSYAELEPFLPEIDRQFRMLSPEEGARNPFEEAVTKLRYHLIRYQGLETTFLPPEEELPPAVSAAVVDFTRILEALPEETTARARQAGFRQALRQYRNLAEAPALAVIPHPGSWQNFWEALTADLVPPERPPAVHAYARLTDAAGAGDAEAFNAALAALREGPLAPALAEHGSDLGLELGFNRYDPFYRSMGLYVLLFLVVCVVWLRPREPAWRQVAMAVLVAAFVIHSIGLGSRMLIQDLPPVTNLYSSAVFVGWATAALGIALERYARNGLGCAVAALVGFTSLIIAKHLALSGDTMEQMRAVLNSNFWLTTHVITIMLGYAASFVAGILAVVFLLLGLFTRSIDAHGARTAEQMVFGTVCFTLLFSFIGTVLGGIWADQSWGRFWGWDPKENGALLIVIWNALILHAWAARIIRRRGLMLAAISGNIVTSWSWFGTNMLGIGLHSYGFMNDAFRWLLLFWLSQLLVIALGLAWPQAQWRSREALGLPARAG